MGRETGGKHLLQNKVVFVHREQAQAYKQGSEICGEESPQAIILWFCLFYRYFHVNMLQIKAKRPESTITLSLQGAFSEECMLNYRAKYNF